MFWDDVAWIYDVFANIINRKANKAMCTAVERLISPIDDVLECACGTGLLTGVIAPRCKRLTATDFSVKMLKRAERKYGKYANVRFEQADILGLAYSDGCFDTVVAANVIQMVIFFFIIIHAPSLNCFAVILCKTGEYQVPH